MGLICFSLGTVNLLSIDDVTKDELDELPPTDPVLGLGSSSSKKKVDYGLVDPLVKTFDMVNLLFVSWF